MDIGHGTGGIESHEVEMETEAILHFNQKITVPNTKGYGGIHPLEALKHHQSSLAGLVRRAVRCLPPATATADPTRTAKMIEIEGTARRLPDFVSVTRGPGMRSNLLCGLDTAKGMSVAWQVPLLGVHHMQAHALTPRLATALNSSSTTRRPGFPWLTLLISGGHSLILHSKGLTDHKILATTVDIAIGDALDKCGRFLLPENIKQSMPDTSYARYLSEYAFPDQKSYGSWPIPRTRSAELEKPVNEFGWVMQTPLSRNRSLEFSFSSIPTAVERIWNERSRSAAVDDLERLAFGQSALGVAFEHLASRVIIALENLRDSPDTQSVNTLVVSGGVAANPFLRHFLRKILDVRGFESVELVFPPAWLCTDNAAMIAWTGMEMWQAGWRSELGIDVIRRWSMDPAHEDGGILGVGGWINDNSSS